MINNKIINIIIYSIKRFNIFKKIFSIINIKLNIIINKVNNYTTRNLKNKAFNLLK